MNGSFTPAERARLALAVACLEDMREATARFCECFEDISPDHYASAADARDLAAATLAAATALTSMHAILTGQTGRRAVITVDLPGGDSGVNGSFTPGGPAGDQP